MMRLNWSELTDKEDYEIERPLYDVSQKRNPFVFHRKTAIKTRTVPPSGPMEDKRTSRKASPNSSMYLSLLEDISSPQKIRGSGFGKRAAEIGGFFPFPAWPIAASTTTTGRLEFGRMLLCADRLYAGKPDRQPGQSFKHHRP